MLQTSSQHRLDGSPQCLYLIVGERAAWTVRSDSSPEEDLVGIDVAKAGDETLVEQQGLDSRFPVGEHPGQLAGGREIVQGIGAKAGQTRGIVFLGREHCRESKSARVYESDLLVFGSYHDVGVRGFRLVRCRHLQASRHAEMDDPGEVTFEVDEQKLAPPAEPAHRSPPEAVGKISLPRLITEHAGAAGFSTDDARSCQVRLQAAACGFDLGKLRHDSQGTARHD